MSEKQTGKNYTAMELILAITILFFPILILQMISVLLFVGVLVLLFGFIALGIFGIFELVAGILMMGVGIEKLFSIPMGALAVMGFGVINIGLAMLTECFVLWLFGVVIPAFFKKIFSKEVRHEEAS